MAMRHGDGYSLTSYGQMIVDQARFTPWHDALRRHVHDDSVVLDLGSGPGIVSLLACRYGARKVYAIEPDGSIELGKRLAAKLPGGDRIEWIRGLSTEVELPEKASLVIADLHGVLPFYAGNIQSLADARARHLRPDGILLPKRDLLLAVPASAPWELDPIESPWRRNTLGLDLADAVPTLVNRWWRARAEPTTPDRLLAQPQRWGCIEYRHEETRALDRRLRWTIERPGLLDGLYVWFDGEVDEGLGFSNSPLLPELAYGRAFFPFEHSVDVLDGDRVDTRLAVRRVHDDWIYRWESTITDAQGTVKAAFRQSTFQLRPGQAEHLRKSEAAYVPHRSRDAIIEHAILGLMDGRRDLAAIARELQSQYPDRFASFDRALSAVAACSRTFG